MFTHAYMIMSAIEIVLVTLLIARYIFLEPKIEKKRFMYVRLCWESPCLFISLGVRNSVYYLLF